MIQQQEANGELPKKRISPTDDQSNGAHKRGQGNYTTHDKKNQHLTYSVVGVAARDNWEHIHRALGVQIISNSHRKHTPCPGCGGTDRFRILPDYKNTGRWFCGGGGDNQSGDGFSLLCHVFNWTPRESLYAVADLLGLTAANENELNAIRKKAEAQAEQMRLAAIARDEQARRDNNMLGVISELENAITERQRDQRTVNRIGGRKILKPTDWEIYAIRELISEAMECYGDLIGGGVKNA